MTTSGTTNFNPQLTDIIQEAYDRAGIVEGLHGNGPGTKIQAGNRNGWSGRVFLEISAAAVGTGNGITDRCHRKRRQ